MVEGVPFLRFTAVAYSCPGEVLSPSNFGFAEGVSGCSEVLHTLFLVLFEYTERVRGGDQGAELVVLCVDYASFFNTLQAPIIDSVLGERGVPGEFRSLALDVGSGATVVVSTLWGCRSRSPFAEGVIRAVWAHRDAVGWTRSPLCVCWADLQSRLFLRPAAGLRALGLWTTSRFSVLLMLVPGAFCARVSLPRFG